MGALVQLDLMVIALVAYPLGIAVAQTAASTAAVHREQRALRAALEREERAVTRLHEVDRVRSEFLTTVSHELRTPLTSVLGFTQMLADGTVGPTTPEQDAVLRRIDRGAHRLSGLVDNVLSVSRPEVVADDPRPRTQVDVATVLEQAVAGLCPDVMCQVAAFLGIDSKSHNFSPTQRDSNISGFVNPIP